jgi:hypothetical protein
MALSRATNPFLSSSGAGNVSITSPAANTIAFTTGGTEDMRIDSSNNVGIGTTSPSTYVNSQGVTLVVGGNGVNFATIQGRTDGPTGGNNGVSYGGSYSTNPINGARMTINAEGGSGQRGSVSFWTKALDDNTTQPIERMRIDQNGRIQVNGTTVVDSARISVSADGANSTGVSIKALSTSCTLSTYWNTSNTTVGSITTNGTTVAYNTTSDYRLKQNIAPMTGALAKVALLKPVTYKWKSDGSDAEGFIAHELAAVCPDAVTGEKDAVDADGNPVHQGIDSSFLIATLTAAIQELKVIVDAQTVEIAALKATQLPQ